MKISRNSDDSILLIQTKYIHDLLHDYEMTNCASVLTSLANTAALRKSQTDYQCLSTDLKNYQKLIEKLMHLMMQTRLDLAYIVSKLAQFMNNSASDH